MLEKNKNRESKKSPAVFFDRDGVLIPDSGYPFDAESIQLVPKISDTILSLKSKNYLIFVITNQSGIGREYYPAYCVWSLHRKISSLIVDRWKELESSKKPNGDVLNFSSLSVFDGLYFCPHLPQERCSCRKPKTGLIDQVLTEFSIDLNSSYFVGDRETDRACAETAGLKFIGVGKNLPASLFPWE